LKRANLRRKWSTIPKAAPIFVADAHRDDAKRFVARSEEKLTAFLELESAIRLASVELNLLQNPY
jgi:hypothetical protein